MPVPLIQPSFAGGELAPALWARVDLAKYHVGAKSLRNMFVHASGGVSNRPGTRFVGRVRDSTNPVRLIPFEFSTLQTYVLEFGHQYMRVIMDGGHVLEPSVPVTAVAAANPCTITAAGNGFAAGDEVFISGTGIPRLDGGRYLVSVAGDSFQLNTLDGVPVNAAGWGSYGGSGASVARVYTLTTPYSGADLALLKFTQSDDVMTFCHPSYQPRDLKRSQHWAWGLTPVTFKPNVMPPTNVVATSSNTGSGWIYGYMVTAETDSPAEESRPSAPVSCRNAALNQNSGVGNSISWSGVPGASRYRVYKANPVVASQQAGVPTGAMYGYIGSTSGTSFSDTNFGPDFTQAPPSASDPFTTHKITAVSTTTQGSGYPDSVPLTVIDRSGSGTGAVVTATTPVGGGPVTAVTVVNGGIEMVDPVILAVDGNGSGAQIRLTVSAGVVTAASIIKAGSGYANPTLTAVDAAGSGAQLTCTVNPTTGAIASVTVSAGGSGYSSPQVVVTDSAGTGLTCTVTMAQSTNYPGTVAYYQQRKVFAGGNTAPETLWMTKPGNFANMDISSPGRDDDAITVTIASRQVNAIKHLVSVNALLALTASGAFRISGGNAGAPLTPSQTVVLPQAYNGCSDVPPLVVNTDILYVQAKGSTVRDLSYNFYADIYTGSDMTVMSPHLFFGHSIREWAYAEEPFKLVWAVRDDGVMLSLTYLKEQDVYAWSRHDTTGQFLSVASIPEGIEDAVYVVVSRSVPGVNGSQPVQYVERLASRNFLTNGVADLAKVWFVDCGLQYAGAPVSSITGLGHLEGATVAILADGSLQPPQVVTGGTVNLQHPAATITVGLPFTAEVVTLDLEVSQPTIQGKRKKISAITLRLENTRGLKVGPNPDSLVEIKERNRQAYGQPIGLTTGDERVLSPPSWNTDGSLTVRQDNPLPVTLLAVIPEVSIGDTL